MIKSGLATQNLTECAQKEQPHVRNKSGQNKEHQQGPQSDHNEGSDEGNFSKVPSHFDYSEIGLFFGNKQSQMKSNNESLPGKAHHKKQSNELIPNKEKALKQASSKDFSNLDELLENTTIIPNTIEAATHSKITSSDLIYLKNDVEDSNIEESISQLGLDNYDEPEQTIGGDPSKDNKTLKTKPDRIKIKPKVNFPGTSVSKFTKVSPFIQYHNDIDDEFGDKKLEKTTDTEPQRFMDFNQDSSRDQRKQSNLSLLSSDSTIDSDNFAFLHDSFSFGAGGSFGNFGRIDFNSPTKIDSARINSEDSVMDFKKSFSNQKSMKALNSRMMPPITQTDLNRSCMSFYGGYGSGNNSDRSSTNLSFNDDYITSAFHTPQGRQQQSFINQNLDVSNSNNIKNFILNPQKTLDPYRTNSNFGAISQNPNPSFSNVGQMNNQERALQQGGKSNNLNKNNNNNVNVNANSTNNNNNDGKTSRMRRKTQGVEKDDDFEIDVNKIISCGKTSLMIRNIPNKYDRELMIETINKKKFDKKFDFFYLPIDFSNQCNFGYGFINFTSPEYVRDFYNEFHKKKWEKYNSEKICQIRYAKIQGKKALEQHFENSKVMNQPDEKLKPYVQSQYALQQNKFKIEELVRQQKLDSAKEVKENDSKRRY